MEPIQSRVNTVEQCPSKLSIQTQTSDVLCVYAISTEYQTVTKQNIILFYFVTIPEVPNPCQFDPCENGFTCAMNSDNCYGYICLSDKPDPSCASGEAIMHTIMGLIISCSNPINNFAYCAPMMRLWCAYGAPMVRLWCAHNAIRSDIDICLINWRMSVSRALTVHKRHVYEKSTSIYDVPTNDIFSCPHWFIQILRLRLEEIGICRIKLRFVSFSRSNWRVLSHFSS